MRNKTMMMMMISNSMLYVENGPRGNCLSLDLSMSTSIHNRSVRIASKEGFAIMHARNCYSEIQIRIANQILASAEFVLSE